MWVWVVRTDDLHWGVEIRDAVTQERLVDGFWEEVMREILEGDGMEFENGVVTVLGFFCIYW